MDNLASFLRRATVAFAAILAPSFAFGQITLGLSSGSGVRGTGVVLNLTMADPNNTQPASLQWVMTYSTNDFLGVTVAAGSAGTGASKTVSCNNTVAGTSSCVLYGSNANVISGGVVATITLIISASTLDASSNVQFTSGQASAVLGSAISSTNSGSTVTITAAPTWSITGSVGNAGSGATIALTGTSTATTTANSSGGYTFSGLANGPYTVTPTLTGFTFSPPSAAVTVSGANATAATMTAIANSTVPAFVTGYAGSDVRNNFSGLAGMQLTVGSSSLTVSSVGRLCLTGNSASHTVEFVSVTSGQAVTGGSASVNMAGCTAGQFVYANLPAAITLLAGSSYYFASQEVSGGDTWYDSGGVSVTSAATVTNSAYSYSGGTTWSPFNAAKTSYGPPNFQYSIGTGTPFVTGYAGSDVRSNFGGWVGMQLTVGSSSLTVSSVGRLCLTGNSASHTVEFVSVASGQAVTGGSASVNMAGCTAGQFVYASLPAAITLSAGSSYYFASQEVSGGDTWYDSGGVSVTSAATVTDSAYSSGTWYPFNAAKTSYGPPNFQYSIAAGTPFVTGYAGSDVRNNFSGWAGMQLTVGSSSLTVSSVGRLCLTGNSASHTVEFVSVASGQAVTGGSASVNMAGCTAGQFVYASLPAAITLSAGSSYYFASQEVSGGDTWYDSGGVSATSAATVNDSAYSSGTWYPLNAANTSYGPPNFQYSVAAGTPFVTGQAGSGVRNDFSGWAGMQLTVGSRSLTVTSVGRLCLTGNSASHTVEFVSVTSGQAVTGGSASVNMAGCTAGQFVYANLPAAITLLAGSSYYFASQEVSGGDTWYDSGGVSVTSAATVTDSAYSSGTWSPINAPNTSYGPPNFLYSIAAGTPFVTGYAGSDVRNNFGGWVGMQLTVGSSSSLTVTSVGRLCLTGNSASHTVEFVSVASGQAVTGGSASVNMAGCAAGQFVYASLPAAITLSAGSSYYLASQEVSGGDTWYDSGGVSVTSAATVNDSAYSSGTWYPFNVANTSYAPPNFQYH